MRSYRSIEIHIRPDLLDLFTIDRPKRRRLRVCTYIVLRMALVGPNGAGLRHWPVPSDYHRCAELVTLRVEGGGVARVVRERAEAQRPAGGPGRRLRDEARERGVALRRQDLRAWEGRARRCVRRGAAEREGVEQRSVAERDNVAKQRRAPGEWEQGPAVVKVRQQHASATEVALRRPSGGAVLDRLVAALVVDGLRPIVEIGARGAGSAARAVLGRGLQPPAPARRQLGEALAHDQRQRDDEEHEARVDVHVAGRGLVGAWVRRLG